MPYFHLAYTVQSHYIFSAWYVMYNLYYMVLHGSSIIIIIIVYSIARYYIVYSNLCRVYRYMVASVLVVYS